MEQSELPDLKDYIDQYQALKQTDSSSHQYSPEYQAILEKEKEQNGKLVLKKPKSVRKRLPVFKNKRANINDLLFIRYFPMPLIVIFTFVFIATFSMRKFILSLVCGALPLVVFLKIYIRNQKIAKWHVREMFAIYKFPDNYATMTAEVKAKVKPELKKVEIRDLDGGRYYYEPRQFSKPNQLDIKKMASTSQSLKNLVKEHRCIKVQPDVSLSQGIFPGQNDPRLYLFNRNNLLFNGAFFKQLQNWEDDHKFDFTTQNLREKFANKAIGFGTERIGLESKRDPDIFEQQVKEQSEKKKLLKRRVKESSQKTDEQKKVEKKRKKTPGKVKENAPIT